EDRHVEVVSVDAREAAGPELELGAGGRAGEVDRVVAASVLEDDADVVRPAGRGELVAELVAAEAVGVVAGVELDVLVGAHAGYGIDRRDVVAAEHPRAA